MNKNVTHYIHFFGPIDLIHRTGIHPIKQWYRRIFTRWFNKEPIHDGIVEDDKLWVSLEDAHWLEGQGLRLNVVMHPGRGPEGRVHLIDLTEKSVKIFAMDKHPEGVQAIGVASGETITKHITSRKISA